jgi:sterol desaturase/sphingolipid hydroxylase (fatty acid hydroxylase superfamily)
LETIIDFFKNISSLERGLILFGGIAIFWIIEDLNPFIKFQYSKVKHGSLNIFFTLTTILVNFVFAFILLGVSNFVNDKQFGILHWLPIDNIWIYTIVGLLLLDFFGAYSAHFVEHRVSVLWRFHLIHHTDTWVDTTSANRHHPGESAIRFLFTAFGVLIVGSPFWMVFLYQALSVVFSQFNHANIALPKKLDLILSYFIVTPDMHKVHHHYKLPYTDSNYGNIFSVWDRLLGTYKYYDREKIIYGVDTHYQEHEHNSLLNLLKIPFQAKRKPTEIEK